MIIRYKPVLPRGIFVKSERFAAKYRVALPLVTRASLDAAGFTWQPWHARGVRPRLHVRYKRYMREFVSLPWRTAGPPASLRRLELEICDWIASQSRRNLRRQPYSGTGVALPWCCYCGRTLTRRASPDTPHRGTDATREHLVPRAVTPSQHRDPEDVLRDCCRDCNSRRGSRPLLRFLIERRLMSRSGDFFASSTTPT